MDLSKLFTLKCKLNYYFRLISVRHVSLIVVVNVTVNTLPLPTRFSLTTSAWAKWCSSLSTLDIISPWNISSSRYGYIQIDLLLLHHRFSGNGLGSNFLRRANSFPNPSKPIEVRKVFEPASQILQLCVSASVSFSFLYPVHALSQEI